MSNFHQIVNKVEEQVLEEVSLFTAALKVKDQKRLQILTQMIKLKPVDPYAYNQLWIDYFK
ncbi:MAG: hypothetical protein IPO62_05290 [Saprospiraceae bacterium]|nr:hypothetical protein [Saprospiraceae bacterium]